MDVARISEWNSVRRQLRRIGKMLLRPLVQLIRYIRSESLPPQGAALPVIQRETAIQMVERAAVSSSAAYISEFGNGAMLFHEREHLWRHALRTVNVDGLFLEFGVFRGYSINFFAVQLPRIPFHGFDSFRGLREDWLGTNMPAGTFDLGGTLPRVARNVTLHKGQFSETLPRFLAEQPGKLAFVHLDADTEESTSFVLESLATRLVPGSVVVFDEYHSHPLWKSQGELTAWKRLCKMHAISYRYVAFGPRQAVVCVDAFGIS